MPIALRSSLALLKPKGRISIIVYPGHPGGELEGIRVKQWVGGLGAERVLSQHIVNLTTRRRSPELFLLEKVSHQ